MFTYDILYYTLIRVLKSQKEEIDQCKDIIHAMSDA